MKKRLIGVFPAFQQKNYRLYFTGQLVSLIGTWSHVVAEGWLAYQLTHSAFRVGIIAALNTLPVLLFSLFGGAIIDRFPKKTILYYTQTFALIIASLLGILTLTHTIAVWNMSILVFCMGLTQVFDMPARQSFMTEMIEKRYLASALAINSGMFNSARAIGPAIAVYCVCCRV
jgi:MFS family permease